MFAMKHDGGEDDDLLREEVLVIAMAMITRLKLFSSTGHINVPVSTPALSMSQITV